MSVQENKALVARAIDEVWNAGKLATIEELYAPDFVAHDPFLPAAVKTRAGWGQYVTQFRTAFPDVHFTIETQIGEGAMVATRWRVRGTMSGPLLGQAPTGKTGEVTGVTIFRFAGDTIAESWVQRDDLGMLRQIGLVPEAAAVPA